MQCLLIPGGGGGAAAAPAEEVEEVKEKTEFAVKLVSFDAKKKIKVIKEVRAIAELGLKEVRCVSLLFDNTPSTCTATFIVLLSRCVFV